MSRLPTNDGKARLQCKHYRRVGLIAARPTSPSHIHGREQEGNGSQVKQDRESALNIEHDNWKSYQEEEKSRTDDGYNEVELEINKGEEVKRYQ